MTTATMEPGTREEVLSKIEHVEALVRDSVDTQPKAEETRAARRLEWYRRATPSSPTPTQRTSVANWT